MIKKVPFSSNLLQIGNAHFSQNELVWSDGNVVYGRIRAPQSFVPVANGNMSGFWVDEQDVSSYKLCTKDLKDTKNIISSNNTLEVAYAYPCYAIEYPVQTGANSGYVSDSTKYYKTTGGLIYLDNVGNSIYYDDEKIYFKSFGNQITDSHGYAVKRANAIFYDDSGNQRFILGNCAVAGNADNTIMYFYADDDSITNVVATYNNGYITSSDYTGNGTVEITKKLFYYNSNTEVVDISMLEGGNRLWLQTIFFEDGIIANSAAGLIGLGLNANTDFLRSLFQITKYNELYCTVHSKTYDNHNLLMYWGEIVLSDIGGNTLWSGDGCITEDVQNSKKYAYTISASGIATEIARYENQTLYYNNQQYPSGNIAFNGAAVPYLTKKQYKIFIPTAGTPTSYVQGDSGNPAYPAGLTEEAYPSSITVDGILQINLNTFTLRFSLDGQAYTVSGDVLGLSNPSQGRFCFPSGVHANASTKYLYAISQDANKIFKIRSSAQNKAYNKIENCFSLAYLQKRWNRY